MEENNSGDKVDVKQRSRKKLKTFLFCCGKLHWPGDYGGPMFLLPGLVITLYATGALNTVLSKDHQYEICRYLYNHQASNVHCVNVLSIFDPDRCLEHMNGQGIIHCLQKYGYVLTFFLFIQKKAIFEKLGPTIDAAGASGVNILCCSSGSMDDAICLLYTRKEVV
ncbi:uncharacterized protein [Gossypium hirsutum]|uniref:Uncharacterized protein isoform X4 n=1 Tax=Gossypium hirsutum TaxID=3635 RepID=A0ABM3AS24_GOSHI|nr:uncharacterized protein LOC107892090 isoform X4 [Gossypium hirsutum]XP_040957651.1 uncharacterized protein LOC107892090 isoform X4 [Gossypium hirsutum]XP_040957652.1 uncharacterized protein LOC107892090 isoform X4 [Gossypium hirsutum]